MQIESLVKEAAKRKGLREQTIKTYISVLSRFFRIYKKPYHKITKKNILNYIDNLYKWNRSYSTINVHVGALTFFYSQVLHKKITVNIPYQKQRKRLPTFLTKPETRNLLKAITNSKHQLMIKVLYATGMRVSELIKLKIHHFEFNENYGWVRDGKGGKDRLFIVGKKLKSEILSWISQHKLQSQDYLFSGYTNGHMSSQSIQKILKTAATKANIKKNVHPHTLRHSFATHLIQNGYAITEVQPLLGHSSPQTTMIYLHMASPQLLKVQSPYELLHET